MRILHLIDPASPDGGPCTLRLLADVMRGLDGAEHEALILGGSRAADLATRCGVSVCGWIASPRAAPWAAIQPMRKTLRRRRILGKPVDLVHAWTMRSAAQAHLALADGIPCLATLHTGPTSSLAARYSARVLARASSMPVLAATLAVRREFCTAGVPAARVALLPPAIDSQRETAYSRAEVRTRLAEIAETPIDDGTFIIGLMSEPVNWQDARAAATIAARIALSGRQVKLVMHPHTTSVRQAAQLLANLSLEAVLIRDEAVAEPWRIVHGLDAALFLGPGRRKRPAASMLPALWPLAAGVPVVAEASDSLGDILENGVSAMLVKPFDIDAAGDRLARLYDDRECGQRLGAGGRTLAADMYDMNAYCERLRHTYELLLADRTVKTLDDPRHPTIRPSEESVAA